MRKCYTKFLKSNSILTVRQIAKSIAFVVEKEDTYNETAGRVIIDLKNESGDDRSDPEACGALGAL
ncbi:hypothetical protein ACDT12_13085 [Staphylococcus aureus]